MSAENRENGLAAGNDVERKEFWLSSFSIKNRISVLVIIFLISIMGVTSYITLPKESFPNINIPYVFVVTVYPGVSPEDIESLVTRKLEDELAGISEVKTMTSTSNEGISTINLEFDTNIQIEEALQKVREKVDLAKSELPDEAEDPIVQEVNLAEFPIMQVNLSGNYDLEILKELAEDLQDKLESVNSVLGVDLTGGLEREVQIDVDLPKLQYYNISFGDIIAAVQSENITIPGGDITVGIKNFLLRVPGQFETTAPIEDIVITTENNQPIYIRDVANVTFGFKERDTYSTLDGAPVITLGVKKRVGHNILATTDAVKAILEREVANMPPTTTYKITNDQSKYVQSMVSNLENNIISGLILVVGVLLFFLGFKNASFVGIAVPLSMFMTFILLTMIGVTMNMIVLFSLILALGLLVDNSIVVVENIYRHFEEGFDSFEAAKKGTGEVAIPIISGTATTVAAFIPLLFWPGIIGDFMKYLPITLILTLCSSLFVALVINPVLCALFMSVAVDEETGKKSPILTRKGRFVIGGVFGIFLLICLMISFVSWVTLIVFSLLFWISYIFILKPVGTWWQYDGMNKVIEKYEKTLNWCLNHSKTTVGIAVIVLVMSVVTLNIFFPGSELFPENIPPQDVYVQIETPVGTDVEFTKTIVERVAREISGMPFMSDVNSILALSGASIAADMSGGGNSTHLGTVAINFTDYQLREHDVFEAMEYMRNTLPELVAGAKITVEKPQEGPPTGPPINLEVSGKDMAALTTISNDLLRILENHPVYAKLDGLESDLPQSRPEVKVVIDREKAALYNLSTSAIGMTIRQAINGVEASKFRDGKDEYDITVRLADEYRKDLSTLGNLTIFHEGNQIPLSEVAFWEVGDGLGGINHKDSERVIIISADVRSAYQSNAVLLEAQEVLTEYLNSLPQGYTYSWTGQQQEQDESFFFLFQALLSALFLITMILVSQFNSIAKPGIILTSIVMSTAGVFYGLSFFQMPFGLMAMLGIISLAGVVVNNAIVLIDYVDILRSRDKMDMRSALMQAGVTRFRPVILTAITTLVGLAPLAMGFNIDFFVLINEPGTFFSNIGEFVYWGGEQAAWWGPMAIAVIVGLTFATALTLILVPVVYGMLEKGRQDLNLMMFGTTEPGIIKSPEEIQELRMQNAQ